MNELNQELDNLVWVERFKPNNLDECILPKRIKDQFQQMVDSGNIQNYAAIGSAGSGKTSSAVAMCKQLGLEHIIINMSSESGIDTVRSKIVNFASGVSFSSRYKVIIMDECLEENEKVRVGTLDNWKGIPLKDLQFGIDYPIVSFNMETKCFENDNGRLISDKIDDIYEVELKDGSKILLNDKHPFIVEDINGNIIEKTISDGLAVGDKIVKILG